MQNYPMTCVNGAEPESIEETETWADGIIETAKYKGVFTSLLNTRLVSHIGKGCDSVVIMPNAENHLPTFTRNVRLVPRYSFSPFQ